MVLPRLTSSGTSSVLPRLRSIFLSITICSLSEFSVWRTAALEPPHGHGVSTVGRLPVWRFLPAALFAFDAVLLSCHPRDFHIPLLNSRDRSLLSLPELEVSSLLVDHWCVAVHSRGYGCFPEQLAKPLSNRSLAPLARFELGESSWFVLVEEFSRLHLHRDHAISSRVS